MIGLVNNEKEPPQIELQNDNDNDNLSNVDNLAASFYEDEDPMNAAKIQSMDVYDDL